MTPGPGSYQVPHATVVTTSAPGSACGLARLSREVLGRWADKTLACSAWGDRQLSTAQVRGGGGWWPAAATAGQTCVLRLVSVHVRGEGGGRQQQ